MRFFFFFVIADHPHINHIFAAMHYNSTPVQTYGAFLVPHLQETYTSVHVQEPVQSHTASHHLQNGLLHSYPYKATLWTCKLAP